MSNSKAAVALDSQLLVLLVVGSTSPRLIAKHKKTRQFDIEDFNLLVSLIDQRSLLLLPNTLTEASNHLLWHRPPERDHICETLRRFVASHHEIYVESRVACGQPDYLRLGVTDAALLLAVGTNILFTADVALHLAAEAIGLLAVNFNHERERYGLV